MGYADQFALRRSQIFRDKVGFALLAYARNLLAAQSVPDDRTGVKPTAAVIPAGKTLSWSREQEVIWAASIIGPRIDRWIDVAIVHVISNEAISGAGEDAKDSDVLWMVTQIMPDLLREEVR
jgi:hypothetical protein